MLASFLGSTDSPNSCGSHIGQWYARSFAWRFACFGNNTIITGGLVKNMMDFVFVGTQLTKKLYRTL